MPTPPAAPLIGGKDAFAPRSGVGPTPSISWSAPAIGKPTSYVVGIDGGNTPPQKGDIVSLSATIYSGTSFTLPAGYLRSGGAYSGSITANATPGDLINTPIWGFSGNYASATCEFGLFRP